MAKKKQDFLIPSLLNGETASHLAGWIFIARKRTETYADKQKSSYSQWLAVADQKETV